ncbi:hypothetical protein NKH77_32420 [Streptomyces sp. M19]
MITADLVDLDLDLHLPPPRPRHRLRLRRPPTLTPTTPVAPTTPVVVPTRPGKGRPWARRPPRVRSPPA